MPSGFVGSDAILHGTRERYDNNALWAKIQATTAQKRQFFVQHRIGIYLKNRKDASLPKQEFNLEMIAPKFRVALLQTEYAG